MKEKFKKLLEIEKEWKKQIELCEKGIGVSQEINALRERTSKILKEITPEGNIILRRELDRFEKTLS